MTDETEPDDAAANEDEHVEPDVPSESKTASEGGKVLTPEELDLDDSEYVEPLDDDGRYVVSPSGDPPNVAASPAEDEPPAADSRRRSERPGPAERPTPSGPRDSGQQGSPVSPESARSLLADELARARASYGIDIVARFEGETVRHRTVSNDVVGTFEDLVRWYARHVTDDTPADQVIEILLSEASFGVGSEPNLSELLAAHDLDQHDSIADLVEAIRVESNRDL